MFDLVTKNKRVIQVFLALIAITFATWGIESYTQFRSSRDTVASVDGMEISRREFAEELRRQQEQMRRMFGGAIDPALLDTPESRVAVLEGLISQRLLAREAARGHMIMSREAVIDAITSAPEFQEDGKFSTAKYSAYLSSRGISDQGNVAELQSQIALRGSVAVDGVSLTVAGLEKDAFRVSIVPYTLEKTLFGEYEVGRRVHLETDVLAKYVERTLAARPGGFKG